jgi:tRNA threonylcarbamoyladenosine biosynthesis protein TsaB
MSEAAGERSLTLGIDTCTDLLALGAVDGARVVGEARLDSRGAHSETLLPALDALLARAGRRIGEVGRIGVTSGPGRFTSLRVGLATAQGLAVGLGAPVVAVSALEAIAVAAAGGGARSGDAPACVAVALDAGAGVFAALYCVAACAAEPLAPPRFEAPPAFAARARAAMAEAAAPSGLSLSGVAGTGAARAAAALAEAGVAARALPWERVGVAVARLAVRRADVAIDPADIEPVYLRPTQAEERRAAATRTLDRTDAS